MNQYSSMAQRAWRIATLISPQPLTAPSPYLVIFPGVKESERLLKKPQNVMNLAELDSVSFQHLGPNHRFGAYCEHYKTL